jgi:hypothetical protein
VQPHDFFPIEVGWFFAQPLGIFPKDIKGKKFPSKPLFFFL